MRALKRLKLKRLEKLHRNGYLKHPVEKDEFAVSEEHQAWGEEHNSNTIRPTKRTKARRRYKQFHNPRTG